MATPIIGVIFGGIYYMGWNFGFLAHIEPMQWRISSAIITGIPIAAFMTCFMKILEESLNLSFIRGFSAVGTSLSKMVLPVGVPGAFECTYRHQGTSNIILMSRYM